MAFQLNLEARPRADEVDEVAVAVYLPLRRAERPYLVRLLESKQKRIIERLLPLLDREPGIVVEPKHVVVLRLADRQRRCPYGLVVIFDDFVASEVLFLANVDEPQLFSRLAPNLLLDLRKHLLSRN